MVLTRSVKTLVNRILGQFGYRICRLETLAPLQTTVHASRNAGEPYAAVRRVDDPGDCHWYHFIEIPGFGLMKGQWDLRGRELEYLGHVGFAGKRVLEIGTSNGYLCFWMERQGADVVAYDLSPEYEWDVVPFARPSNPGFAKERQVGLGGINNAFWLGHRVFNSKARVVYGTAYEIPSSIGAVDITTFGSVLLHVRDPFRALRQAARLTRETIIVAEPLVIEDGGRPVVEFVPDPANHEILPDTWWWLSPTAVQRMLVVLGFEESTTSYHSQRHKNGEARYFTVVARRTVPFS